ncbi:MAG: tRNA epoxyqueuosine(34) reductase QueG [Bacteroidales bacterium]
MKRITQAIKQKAAEYGFDAVGIARAMEVDLQTQNHFRDWLASKAHAEMAYMENYPDKRFDPTLLVEGAKSVIAVALNYYPSVFQKIDQPQISYYAYGEDYHEILKEKLNLLFSYIHEEVTPIHGRCFADTAPILERHWAEKAGLGFVGKNNMLIIPGKGSYFFLGFLIIDLELIYDEPMKKRCGNCSRCQDSCPTKALSPYFLDSQKCISYLTIENRKEIPAEFNKQLGTHLYGCDECQKACPWNRFASPCQTTELQVKECILQLDTTMLDNMEQQDFSRMFKGSPIKRAKFSGLKRNWFSIRGNMNCN